MGSGFASWTQPRLSRAGSTAWTAAATAGSRSNCVTNTALERGPLESRGIRWPGTRDTNRKRGRSGAGRGRSRVCLPGGFGPRLWRPPAESLNCNPATRSCGCALPHGSCALVPSGILRAASREGQRIEANRLVVPGRRTHVAERQPIFDEGGSAAALAATRATGACIQSSGLLRVHAITWIRHPWISLVRGWATASLLATGADGREFATVLRRKSVGSREPSIRRLHQSGG